MDGAREPWWSDATIYQIYPRSFQDSDGDGEGDLAGIVQRLEHVAALGADAVWLSPIYPSPMADGGYDVADYEGVRPTFGTLADADALIAAAHRLGLKVVFDAVPCHTSIEHPWFVERPEFYTWSDRDGPQNNWRSTFGGGAWARDPHGRGWYLHSFYPEQPDLDWRNPEVAEAFGAALRFWLARGVDGFRLDALDRLLKDPERRDDRVRDASSSPVLPEDDAGYAQLEHDRSRNAPDIGTAIAQLRAAAGDAFLVGEVYLRSEQLAPYLDALDTAFSFELFQAPWTAGAVRGALAAAAALGDGRAAWVLSNHDFPRLPNRVGAANVRAAALLLLSLPGTAFVFQGDEIGMADGQGRGPGAEPDDRHGRDRHRHPMVWDASPQGGFTSGTPWLPVNDPGGVNVADQERDPGSILRLYRDLIALRRTALRGPLALLADRAPGVVAFTRGDDHVVALNLGDAPAAAPAAGTVLRHTHDLARSDSAAPGTLAPGEGFVAVRS
ncbi:Oligo-1,6-glucosidase [Baekduia alba]|uniref:alpha-amylase family glycosyl hydrolase n=1 Tax=Baekduia alba TaxID=2997333 RepID=UPI002340AE0C|nr:alpha-amylase family glycosyl hydrolase [Baekduia alba]WCB93882.1 Oligo-1,6-glucosidase [Baekduia alba]